MSTGRIHDQDARLTHALGLDAPTRAPEATKARSTKRSNEASTSRAREPDAEAAYRRTRSRAAKQNEAALAKTNVHADERRITPSSPLFVRDAKVTSHHHHVHLRKTWRELEHALAGVEPLEPKVLAARLGSLGFSRAQGRGAETTWTKGDAVLAVERFELGHFAPVRLSLARAGKERAHVSGVAIGGVIVPEGSWRVLEDRYQTELARFVHAVEATRGRPLPTDMTALKRFEEAGLDPEELRTSKARSAEIDRRLADLTHTIERLKKDGRAPKGIIVYVCGPDGAGKSSTGEIVMKAIARAGYGVRKDSFKAPSEEERKHFWLDRFRRGIPSAGEAFFWDRGPAGDVVYGEVSKKREKQMAKELLAFEEELRGDGVLLVKIELHASKAKQADTFGKRLARQHLADRLEDALRARGHLGDRAKAGLDQVAAKIDAADLRALVRYDEVQARYEGFIEKTEAIAPWLAIDATHRHEARLALIAGLEAQLEAFSP